MKAPLQDHRLGFWRRTACAALGPPPHTQIGPRLLAIILTWAGWFSASAQSFTNLDFESATLIPSAGDWWGWVQFGPALPGWTGYFGTDVARVANYDLECMDSWGISILDASCTNCLWPAGAVLHGRYCVLLQSGETVSTNVERGTAIAQTGTVPSNAKSILFNAGPFPLPSGITITNLVVTFDGTQVAFDVEAVIGGSESSGYYGRVAGNISPFAGRTGELRFTAPCLPPVPNWNNVFLDYIRFSTSPPSQAPKIQSSPPSRTANLGSTVNLYVCATGGQSLAYQWVFDGTNALTGATSTALMLTNVQLSDSGTYTVVVTNTLGSVTSSPAVLTVGFSPSVLTPPQTQTAEVGSSPSLLVKANGAPPPTYQWFFSGSGAERRHGLPTGPGQRSVLRGGGLYRRRFQPLWGGHQHARHAEHCSTDPADNRSCRQPDRRTWKLSAPGLCRYAWSRRIVAGVRRHHVECPAAALS